MMNKIFSLVVSLWITIDSSIFMFISHDFKYLYMFSLIFAIGELIFCNKHILLKLRRSLLFSLLMGYAIIKLFTEYYSGLSICFVIIIALIIVDYKERNARTSQNSNT